MRTKQYEGIVTDTTYILSAIFDGQTYTKSTSVEFRLKKYYGVSVREMLTDEEVLALSSLWAGVRKLLLCLIVQVVNILITFYLHRW
ncbi:hypothetical protein SFC43_31505 [Bacteroides sp. CR5/BHMF/2]|nr:hypothetical protein [Bacteroides sp. CR5/BHMF/2]